MKKLLFLLLLTISLGSPIHVGIDSFLHYTAGSTVGSFLTDIGITGNERFILGSMVFIGKELSDPVFSGSDLLFDYIGLFNGR